MNLWTLYLRRINKILLLILLLSCRNNPLKSISTRQGIKGNIQFCDFSSNHITPPSIVTFPVEREIFIFPKTSIQEVLLAEGNFISTIFSEEIISDWSDENGHFEFDLDPGEYSLFIKENERYYSKLNNEEEFFYPFKVNKNNYSEIKFNIDYKLKSE